MTALATAKAAIQAKVQPRVAQVYLSEQFQTLRRFSVQKFRASDPNTLYFFCQLDDPQSYILAQALARLSLPSEIRVEILFVNYSDPSTHPEPQKSRVYHLKDAQLLAKKYALHKPNHYPDDSLTQAYLHHLLAQDKLNLTTLSQTLIDYWQAKTLNTSPSQGDKQLLQKNNQTLKKLGHYASANIYFRGEFYTGLDRLAYLQQALSIPLAKQLFSRQEMQSISPNYDKDQALDVFFSFRSPYSYIALDRLSKLDLQRIKLRPILPMVMRGLPVPASKRFYILRDAKREAVSLGVPFGKVKDPLGKGVEHCLALFFYAETHNKALEFSHLAMQKIWSQGIDMSDLNNLKILCQEVGLDWNQAQQALLSEDWLALAEANREAMFKLGVWGVPSFYNHAKEQVLWGQDRLALALQPTPSV